MLLMRKLIILGVFAGSSASIPIVYQSNPEVFQEFLKSSVASRPADPGSATPEVNVAVPQAQPVKAMPTGRKVTVAADSRGHFAAEFKLNGREVDAMIDTGATLVALNTSTARRIGLSLAQSDFKHEVNTANGSIKAAIVTVDRLQIGKIALDGVQAVVLDDKALRTNLIGLSFLKRLDRYEVQDNTLLMAQ